MIKIEPIYQRHIPVIVQVGVGGTGSNVAQQVAQLLATIGEGHYVLADPDVVEEKNLRNQLFSQANVGST
ncbi:ThiF family adenylyltransferase [Piscibacillus sp. B03]|uniref:ThiF family adenylyltransferase n=1 Tax=Piscibacillus sp. B03 TaxID=3457430 RepID=UPI003FCDE4B0